ncbi:MAG: BatD family protein [Planctomycetia bacterium]|nr:BatD family protein [Planctomycetia bacterium]
MQGLTASEPLELTVPWLTGMPEMSLTADEWLNQYADRTGVIRPGLKLRCMNRNLQAPQSKPGIYELRWTMTVKEPAGDETTQKLAAVQVGKWSTQPLVLEIRRLNLLPAPAGVWDLGVGSYQVTASWSKPTVLLGEEVELQLRVQGKGALKRLSTPELANQPGWEQGRFLIDSLPDVSQPDARIFRYRIRPRQLKLAVPPVTIRDYDPSQGALRTTQVKVPSLKIVLGSAATSLSVIKAPAEAISWLPEFQQLALKKNNDSWHWPRLNWLIWLPITVAGIVMLRVMLERIAPEPLKKLRWQWARWKLIRKLQRLGDSAEPVIYRTMLAEYLGEGLEIALMLDHDSLQAAVLQTSQASILIPILDELEEAELGPATYLPGELHNRVLGLLRTRESP